MDGTDLRQIRVVREVTDVRKQQQTEDTVSKAHTNEVTDLSAISVHREFCYVLYQGHPTDRFGKLSVRKTFNPL